MEGISLLQPRNEGCRDVSICKSLQPLPEAVYTRHEILNVPQGWEPTSISYGDDQSDLQRVPLLEVSEKLSKKTA